KKISPSRGSSWGDVGITAAGVDPRPGPLAFAQIVRVLLALVRHDVKADLVTLIEIAKTGLLHRADVHEYVAPAAVRLNEAIALGCVEPLNSTGWHLVVLLRSSNSSLITTYDKSKTRRSTT